MFRYLNLIGLHIVGLLVFYLINPFEYGYLAGYLLTPLVYIKRDFLLRSLDLDYFLVLLFSLIYALFSLFNPEIHTQTLLFYGAFPHVFFLLGKYFSYKDSSQLALFYVILATGFLYSFSALVSVLLNLLEGGFVQYDRSIQMFWTGEFKSATLMGAFFTFNMCIPALLIIKKPKFNRLVNLVLAAIFLVSLFCVFRLGSRTQIVIVLLTTVITMLFIIPKQSINKNLRIFITLLLIAGIVYLYIPVDLSSDYLSVLGRRLQESDNTGSAGGRTDRWVKSFFHLFDKPLGWDLREFGYSHNLWLDVARATGSLPFLLLLVFSIRTLIKTRRAVLLNRSNLALNSIFISYTIAANLLFFVEPVVEGIFSFFLVYCFLQGIINRYLHNLEVTAALKKSLPSGT